MVIIRVKMPSLQPQWAQQCKTKPMPHQKWSTQRHDSNGKNNGRCKHDVCRFWMGSNPSSIFYHLQLAYSAGAQQHNSTTSSTWLANRCLYSLRMDAMKIIDPSFDATTARTAAFNGEEIIFVNCSENPSDCLSNNKVERRFRLAQFSIQISQPYWPIRSQCSKMIFTVWMSGVSLMGILFVFPRTRNERNKNWKCKRKKLPTLKITQRLCRLDAQRWLKVDGLTNRGNPDSGIAGVKRITKSFLGTIFRKWKWPPGLNVSNLIAICLFGKYDYRNKLCLNGCRLDVLSFGPVDGSFVVTNTHTHKIHNQPRTHIQTWKW